MRLVRGQDNTVSLRLKSNASTANPQWLFKLTNEFSKEYKVFAAEDISEYPEVYNLFIITETDDEDLTNGHVRLSPSGQWSCEVFEMEESSPRSLDPDQALKTVKECVCVVYDGSEGQVNNFEEDDDEPTKVFDVE